MLKSMTAFGRARAVSAAGDKDVTVEIRSTNSRFLDFSFKMPRYLSGAEDMVRDYITSVGVVRGKVDVFVAVDILRSEDAGVVLDTAAAENYISALHALRDEFGLTDDISVMEVAKNRELFRIVRPDDDIERDFSDIFPALSAAAGQFRIRRESEGRALQNDISEKFAKLREMLGRIKALSEDDIDGYRDRLYMRIKRILDENGLEIAEGRILTEAAVYADRASIDEEIVRLSAHLDAAGDTISSDDPAGRKLDFLLQEMNREVNTIGSKAGHTEISHLVVDMKGELEKIREQIQNVE